MLNKSTTKDNTKNSVLTPDVVKKALENLPYNYILKVQERIAGQIEVGEAKKNYSSAYIIKVRKGEAFNEVILKTLVEVGIENFETQEAFGFSKRKTPLAT